MLMRHMSAAGNTTTRLFASHMRNDFQAVTIDDLLAETWRWRA